MLIRLHRCAGWSASLLFTYGINMTGVLMTWLLYKLIAVGRLDVGSIYCKPAAQADVCLSCLHDGINRLIWASRQNQQNGMCAQWRQISLGICPVWLSPWRKLGSVATHWTHSEDSDQTGQMPWLIWVFAGHTVTLLVLSRGGSFHDVALLPNLPLELYF